MFSVRAKSLQVCPTLGNPTRTVACLAPLSMGFSGKNTGVGCHDLLQVDLPDPGIEHVPPASPALAGGFFTTSAIIMFSTLKIFKYYVIDNNN